MSLEGMDSFKKGLRGHGRLIFDEGKQKMIEIASFLLARVVFRTRRDTGRAAQGWQISFVEPGEGEAQSTVELELYKFLEYKFGEPIWVSNDVHYITYLEFGSPTNVPDLMLTNSLQETEAQFGSG